MATMLRDRGQGGVKNWQHFTFYTVKKYEKNHQETPPKRALPPKSINRNTKIKAKTKTKFPHNSTEINIVSNNSKSITSGHKNNFQHQQSTAPTKILKQQRQKRTTSQKRSRIYALSYFNNYI